MYLANSSNISEQLQKKLLSFNQRALNDGEIFLLAKALSDAIPLPKPTEENVGIHNLNYRNFIQDVIGKLEGYAYLPPESHETIYRLVNDFMKWRFAVANGTCVSTFSGDVSSFVDDVTGVLRYINMSDFANGSVIAENAGFTYSVFKELAGSVK